MEGNIKMVKKLLQLGVDVNDTNAVSLIPYHGTIMSWYYHVMVLSCHGTIMSWYYHVMVLSCHGTIMSWYYHVMVLSCHGTIMSWYYHVMVLSCHGTISIPCHGKCACTDVDIAISMDYKSEFGREMGNGVPSRN